MTADFDPHAPNLDSDRCPQEAETYFLGRTHDGTCMVVELCSGDEQLALVLDRDEFAKFLGHLTRIAAKGGFLQ